MGKIALLNKRLKKNERKKENKSGNKQFSFLRWGSKSKLKKNIDREYQ